MCQCPTDKNFRIYVTKNLSSWERLTPDIYAKYKVRSVSYLAEHCGPAQNVFNQTSQITPESMDLIYANMCRTMPCLKPPYKPSYDVLPPSATKCMQTIIDAFPLLRTNGTLVFPVVEKDADTDMDTQLLVMKTHILSKIMDPRMYSASIVQIGRLPVILGNDSETIKYKYAIVIRKLPYAGQMKKPKYTPFSQIRKPRQSMPVRQIPRAPRTVRNTFSPSSVPLLTLPKTQKYTVLPASTEELFKPDEEYGGRRTRRRRL